MIHLALTDSHLYCVQWTKTEADIFLTSLEVISFQHPLGDALQSETEFVSVFSSALNQLNESGLLESEDVFVTLPDHWTKIQILSLDREMSEADGLDLANWTIHQRWGESYSKNSTLFGRFFNKNKLSIFSLSLLSKCIEPVKLSLISAGANPIWMGTESSVFYGMSPQNGCVVLTPDTGLYLYAIYENADFGFGKCRMLKGGWHYSNQIGQNPEEILKNKTIYISDILSGKRKKHFENSNFVEITPFMEMISEGIIIPKEFSTHIQIVSTAVILGSVQEVTLNLFDSPGLQPYSYEEKIVTPTNRIEKKEKRRRKKKNFSLKKSNFQSFFTVLITLIILLAFVGIVYYKNVGLKPSISEMPSTQDSLYEHTKNQDSKKINLKSPEVIDKYYEKSQSILTNVIRVFQFIPIENIVFLSLSNGTLKLELTGGEVMDVSLDSIGQVSSYSLTEIPCCGGYKHGYLIDTKDFPELYSYLIADVDSILKYFESDSTLLSLKTYRIRQVENFLQHPVVLRVSTLSKITEFLTLFKNLPNNIAVEKISYYSKVDKHIEKATFYISLFEPAPKINTE